MRRPTLLACALLCGLTSCGWGGFTVEVGRPGERPAREDAGPTPPVDPWGAHAAGLDIAPCDPSFEVLVVDTTAESLDGGDTIDDPGQAGPELSLLEAFWIGSNRQRPHTITFDPRVFPVDAPGLIALTGQVRFPVYSNQPFEYCLDGRGRGVIIEWQDPSLGDCVDCVPSLNAGARIIGLTLRKLPRKLSSGAGQIAGCRLHSVYKVLEPLGPTLIGPGNAFSGASWAITVKSYTDLPSIIGNDFGHDPLLGEVESNAVAIDLFEAARIEDNVFAPLGGGAIWLSGTAGVRTTASRNTFGVDRDGTPLTGSSPGLGWLHVLSGALLLGPDNKVRLTGGHVISAPFSRNLVELTRNSVFGQGRLFQVPDSGQGLPPVDPPALVTAGPDHVEGTCAVPGRVEVFSDPGALAEAFVGEVACDAISPWRLEAAVPRGRNVTATLTDAQRRTSELSAPLAVP